MYEDDRLTLSPPPKTDSGYVDALASRDDVLKLRDIVAQLPGAWVSFREDFSLAFNGTYSNHITPEAIYAMPADRVVMMADDYVHVSKEKQMRSLFHCTGYTRRPAAVVFRPQGRIVSTENYADYPQDFDRLFSYVSQRHPDALHRLEGWKPKKHYDAYLASCAVFWMTEKVTDAIVKAQEYRDFYHHPNKPRVWRELMMAMGIDAFEDRNYLMTGDCREQIAVFEPSSVEIVAAFNNPAAAFPVTMTEDRTSAASFAI